MAAVRAKFKVDAIERNMTTRGVVGPDGQTTYVPAEMRTVKLSPVYQNGDPTHENSKFWQYTPSGQISLGCINLEAADAFELGKEYYVDFTPAAGG